MKRNNKKAKLIETKPLPETNHNHDNDDDDDSRQQMELLKNIISNELANHNELNDQARLIKTLCTRLHQALQNNEEIRKSEMVITQELQDMKQEMQQFTTTMMMNGTKSRPSTTINSNHSNNDESSLELCRKQILNQSSFLSQIDYNHIDMTNLDDQCDHDQKQQQPNNVHQILIEQIRILEKKMEIERHSYMEENERLNIVIDEKQKLIDNLLLNNNDDHHHNHHVMNNKKISDLNINPIQG